MRQSRHLQKNLTAQSVDRRKGFCSELKPFSGDKNRPAAMGCRLREGMVGNLQKVMLRVEGGLCMVLIINADKNILMKYNGFPLLNRK